MAATTGFHNLAVKEMVGLTWDRGTGRFEGWGNQWMPDQSARFGVTPVTQASKWTHLLSGARTLGTAASVYSGWKEEGTWGAAKWLGAEYIASGLVATAAAGGMGLGGQTAMTMGGVAGMILTGGSPFGYAAGTWATGSMITGGVAAWATPVALAGMAAAVGTYYAAKGTYSVLRNGYNYRQRMMTKIDTAGSTAAFMNKNAFTMRSRAVEAIRNNHLNARSAIGQEAQLVHFNAYRKITNTRVY